MKLAFISLGLLFLLLGCEESAKITPSSKIIKIGVLAPLSGTHKDLGIQGILGIKAALKMERYLQNRDKIVLVIVDTRSTEEDSRKALKKLVDAEVVAIFSFMGSGRTLALKDEFNAVKIPIIATLSTDKNIVSLDGYISQVCMDNDTQMIIASHYIRDEELIQDVGIIYSSDSKYYSLLADDFKKYFTILGGKVNFFIDISSKKGLAEFENIKNSDISMLFSSIKSNATHKVVKTIKTQKFDFKVLGVNGSIDSELDSFYVIEHYADDVLKSDKREELEGILEKESLKNRGYAFLSYDGYQLLRYALKNCHNYSSECINARIKNSDIIKGFSGNFIMLNSRAKREVYIDKIEDGRLKKEVVVY